MPKIIRMPPETELPAGPARDFVLLLFRLYRAAHRPTLETISRHIRDGGYDATASKETLRKMLRGTTIPANWKTVEAVIQALCDLGEAHPDDRITLKQSNGDSIDSSVMYIAETLWHQALDEPERRAEPEQTNEAVTPGDMGASTYGAGVTGMSTYGDVVTGPPTRSVGTGMGPPVYSPVVRLPDGSYVARDSGTDYTMLDS